MKEGASDNKNDKSENNDERKEAECLDDRNNDKNKNMMRKKMRVKRQIPIAPQWMKVKE